MSHYTKVNTQIVDQDCLVKALAELGYSEVEIHDEPVHLYGYQGDVRPETANIIVRRKFIDDASNDIGFKCLEDGSYEAIVSEWDKEFLGEDWVNRVCKIYAYNIVMEELEAQGYTVDKKEGEVNSGKEKVHLVLRRS